MEERETPPEGEQKDGKTQKLVKVYENRGEDESQTCLRPLGLCELGGCCDICWYNPNHPRFSVRSPSAGGHGRE